MNAPILTLRAAVRFPVGTDVGAHRWPWHGSHPDCWGRPWRGVVIPLDDPRAWTGTLAFSGTPAQAEASAHVAWCHANGLMLDRVAVLWDFGSHGTRVYFENVSSLRPYAADVAEWESELAAERARCDAARTRKIGG